MVTCVSSGDFGFAPMRTRSTGPCLIDVTVGSEEVVLGMSITSRGVPSFGS